MNRMKIRHFSHSNLNENSNRFSKSFTHLNRAETQFTFNAKYPKNKAGSGANGARKGAKLVGKSMDSSMGTQRKKYANSHALLAIPAKFKLSKISSVTTAKNSSNSNSRSSTRAKTNANNQSSNTRAKVSTSEKFALMDKDQLNNWYEACHQNKNQIWPAFDLSSPVMDAIKFGLQFTHPAPVQSIFLSANLDRNILCGSQTGSGKTAAYLVSIFDHLKKEEMAVERSTKLTDKNTCLENETDTVMGTNQSAGLEVESALNSEAKSSEVESSINSEAKSSKVENSINSEAERSINLILDSDIDTAFSLFKEENVDNDAPTDLLDMPTSPLTSLRKLKRPRAVILVPSRHLVHQITGIAKTMSHYCRLRVVGLHSKTKNARSSYEESPIDILITTPTTLLHLIQEEGFSLSQTCRMILDEADTLFDKNFLSETTRIIQMVRKIDSLFLKNKETRDQNRKLAMTPIHLFTATFPQTLNQTTSALFSSLSSSSNMDDDALAPSRELIKLTTPSLHRPVKSVHHAFLRLNQSTTKNNLLMETIKRAATAGIRGTSSSVSRILVFCNTQDSAKQVYSFLKTEKKVPGLLLLSSHLPIKELETSLHTFMNKSTQPKDGENQKDEGLVIAVSTDLASRGLDTLHVGHVINYDFPLTVMDYVHRTGRTGRYGRKGRATSFVERRDWNLASEIEERVKRGLSL